MKPIVIAPVAILLLAPRLARAQDVHVYKDQQGVQTYTNVPASRRPAKLPRKDEDGALVYSNLPASGVRKPSAEPEPTEESPAFTVVPASPLQEPLQEPPPPPNYGAQGTPSGSGAGSMPASGSDGQWVYTDQYGWVWMPYGARYVSEGSPGDETPYAYVYDPSDGWGWVSAPWVWGWGAYPYFGALGPGRFGWYTGLMHAGYGWGGYRGGGPGRVGFARSFSVGHRAGGFTGRGFAGGARFRSGGGGHFGAPAAHARFSGGGGFRGGGGFSGGHGGGGFGGGGHAGGGHGGGGRR